MGFVLRYIWGTKVCLIGWNAYKACSGENGNAFLCFLASSYFVVLVLATLYPYRGIPKPQQIDALESEYLQKLEEGLSVELKQD
jgi:hypothetical protein